MSQIQAQLVFLGVWVVAVAGVSDCSSIVRVSVGVRMSWLYIYYRYGVRVRCSCLFLCALFLYNV